MNKLFLCLCLTMFIGCILKILEIIIFSEDIKNQVCFFLCFSLASLFVYCQYLFFSFLPLSIIIIYLPPLILFLHPCIIPKRNNHPRMAAWTLYIYIYHLQGMLKISKIFFSKEQNCVKENKKVFSNIEEYFLFNMKISQN